MAKILAVAVVVLFVVACSAELPRSNRRLRNRSRFLARQEILEDVPAQTPYPAAGDKPDVAFDLPADESAVFGDKSVIGVPDQTYGAPDQTYGPPEAEAVPVQPQDNFDVESEPQSQRFTSIRGNNKFVQKGNRARPAPLRKAAPLQAAPQLQPLLPQQPQLLAQPILLADGRIVYNYFA